MPTVTCPKCAAKVDTSLTACPKCGLSRMAEAKQNMYIQLVKVLLIPFNILLAIWLISSLHIFSRAFGADDMVLERASQNEFSPLIILAIWVIGDALLLFYLWKHRTKKRDAK